MSERVQQIRDVLSTNRLLILSGPLGAGRSELCREALGAQDFQWWNLGEKAIRKKVQAMEAKELFEASGVIVFQEAQRLDHFQEMLEAFLFGEWNTHLICICSGNPPIDEVLKEALEAQGLILEILPPSFKELAGELGPIRFDQQLEQRLIYGHLADLEQEEEDLKQELLSRAEFLWNGMMTGKGRINKEEELHRLLSYLALKLGENISFNELGNLCGLDNQTVERYVELLEDAYVLIKLPSYQSGQRYEMKKGILVYFYDNGIRNALINNFNPMELRLDQEVLWKNWLISERHKLVGRKEGQWFWQTHTGQQVDYLEQKGEQLRAYQLSWNKKKRRKWPKSFLSHYPEVKTSQLDRSTYWNFLSRD
ncbi:MAG: DUF4143 domain-containing protein [Bacteroidetes bacterium]|nr:MAG: DUF4143 domain-containing protein [Bacteroidota bacterium]